MLSPVKLYKHDMARQRKPITWAAHGNPNFCSSGSPCFRHPNVDWTVHRLVPAMHANRKPGGVAHKIIGRAAVAGVPKHDQEARHQLKHNTGSYLQRTSPRWGDGKAPSRRVRSVTPLPSKESVSVSKKTYAAGGAAVAAYGGYKAYQHRDQIRSTAHNVHEKVNNAFHSSRLHHGNVS